MGEEGVIFQNDVYDCGVACLEMILRHYDLPVERGEISQDANDNKGMSLLHIQRTLEDNGLSAKGWRLSFDDLYLSDLPAIALVDKSHYLVIEAITDDSHIIVLDPAIGKLKYSRKTFCKSWGGEVLLVRQSNPGGNRKEEITK